MSFSFRQNAPSSGGFAANINFPSTPLIGNLVIASLGFYGGLPTAASVQDGNGNVYTPTPGTPFNSTLYGSSWWIFYWVVTGTPSANVKQVSQTGTGNPGLFATEFNVVGGTPVFDTDVGVPPAGNQKSDGAGHIGTPPSITPAAAGELLFGACSPNNSITAPTTGSTLGGWTGAYIDSFLGWATEYILSCASGATAASYTDNTANDTYNAAIAAFTQVAATSAQRGGADFFEGRSASSVCEFEA